MAINNDVVRRRAEQILAQLSRQEKAKLCSGESFWHLPALERFGLVSIMLTDGPHGLRKQPAGADHLGIHGSIPATCFPSASALAATWNVELIERMGQALGRECRKEGVSVLLGPGINIKRNPRGGRNFEYFSEDPYLSGVMACAWIDGVQSQGVGASLKHYAVNNHESNRMIVDIVIDERTLREIYLPAFEMAVTRSRPWTVMCSYNKLHGEYLAENRRLLHDILVDEWGFDGVVVTDWSAINDPVDGIRSGLHLEMPSSGDINTNIIVQALKSGKLSAQQLDDAVRPVLELIIRANHVLNDAAPIDQDHHQLASDIAAQACVLLKNDNNFLPLSADEDIAVIGALATSPRYQGAGSSQINPLRLALPLQELQHIAGDNRVSYCAGYQPDGDIDQALMDEAVELAARCDKIILFAGLYSDMEAEGFDREHIQLPQNQLQLIEALARYHHKMVLVLQNGAPVAIPATQSLAAIVEAYLGGQAGASALANILYGIVNPSAKLAETLPLSIDDVPSEPWFPGDSRQCQYREGIWVGYRYFDSFGVPVAFPFGHGLSYTRFEYSAIELAGLSESESRLERGGTLIIRFSVQNTGDRSGAEIAQLYLGQLNCSAHRPGKELKRFCKIWLQPGEIKPVEVTLNYRDFAYWCTEQNDWVVDADRFRVFVGASIADIRHTVDVQVAGREFNRSVDERLQSYFPGSGPLHVNDQSFCALLGHDIPRPVPVRPFHLNSTLNEVRATLIGNLLHKGIITALLRALGPDASAMDIKISSAAVENMPLRNVVLNSQGKMSMKLLSRLIHLINGDWGKFFSNEPAASR